MSERNYEERNTMREVSRSYRSQRKELLIAKLEHFKPQAEEYCVGLAKKFTRLFL